MECTQDFYLHNFKFRVCNEFDENLLKTGTSIYEVIKVEKGIPIFLEEHLNRLFDSADISHVNINESYCDIETLISELIKKNQVEFGKIKIIVRFEDYNGKSEKDFLIYFTPHVDPSAEEYAKGVKVGVCDAVRLNPNAKIYNTDARKKANDRIVKEKLFEVLLMNKDGFVTEGSRSNVFFIQNDQVITPPETDALNGITRQKIIDICKQNNIPFKVEKINYLNINKMDSLFLTGTSIKALPVRNVGDCNFDTQNKTLRKIMNLYDKSIQDYIASKV